MSEWGGKRIGAGRKSELGKTVVMRVPESRIEEIKQLISNVDEKSDYDNISKVKEIIAKWDAQLSSERSKQPRWENVSRLLNELKTALLPE